jgi:hypothetical protein
LSKESEALDFDDDVDVAKLYVLVDDGYTFNRSRGNIFPF